MASKCIDTVSDMECLKLGGMVHLKGLPHHTLVITGLVKLFQNGDRPYPVDLVTVDKTGRPHAITVSAMTLVAMDPFVGGLA